MLIKNTDGVRWEFERVVAERAVFKTLFLFEPAVQSSAGWQSLENMVAPLLESLGVGATALNRSPLDSFVRMEN